MQVENVRNGKGLSERQIKSIALILQYPSITEGCKQAEISRECFYNWMTLPAYKAEFIKQRQAIIDLALHELKASTSEAVAVLRELLGAEEEGVRLRTAQSILGAVLKSIEIENLEMRVSLLEEKIKNGKS